MYRRISKIFRAGHCERDRRGRVRVRTQRFARIIQYWHCVFLFSCLEFPEFIQLAAKFLIEEDEEQMRWELKEAFRIYDKQGNGQVDGGAGNSYHII